MKLPQTGGCLCGALRYELAQAPVATYACHCTHCQRLSGSAFSLGLVAVAEALRPMGVEPRPLQRIADSGRTTTRWICPECGVWIYSGGGGSKPGTAPPGTLVMLRAGTLDDTSWLRPAVHFWTRSAQRWVTLPEAEVRFGTQPEDYLSWLRSME